MTTNAHTNAVQLDEPIKVTISFTHSCNLDCKICYANCTRTASSKELTANQWIDFLESLLDRGVMSLLFEGGEPLHRASDLIKVVQYCGRKFFTRIRTNGTLVTPKIAQELKQLGVGGMLVDFLGAEAATHDYLTGVVGSHERACRAVKYLRNAGLETEMLLILNRYNAHQLPAFHELATDLGVNMISILRLYPIGRAKHRWKELSLSIEEMMSAIGELSHRDTVTVNHSWHPRNGNTCWQMAAVNAYGDSIGCTYLRELVNFGNITEQSLLDTWCDPLYRTLRSGVVTESCTSCESTQGSCGGCRATAFAFHGRWDAPDPFCVSLNNGVDLRELPDWMLSARPRPSSPTGA